MDYTTNYDRFRSMLSHTKKSAQEDVSAFLDWERGKISTAICIRRFRIHNFIRDDFVIDPSEFEQWLRSLGYIRRY